MEKDSNGFISRLSPSGEVEALRWIDGASEGVTLHAPKGMALRGDTLHVADIDCVRAFHRVTGAPLAGKDHCIDGATFLNDVAADPGGHLYVTDSGTEGSRTDAVWRIGPDGSRRKLAEGEALGRPNGIVASEAGAVVVSIGSGEIYEVTDAGERTTIVSESPGGLDGVILLEDGTLLVSSWEAEGVFSLNPGTGVVEMVASETPSPGDIGHDAGRDRVLIPLLRENRVVIHPR